MNIALLGVGATLLPTVGANLLAFVIWCVGMAGLLLSMLGAAGVLVAKKDLGMVDTANRSHQDPDNLAVFAKATVESTHQGEVTVATNITVFRDSIAVGIYGFVVACAAWMVAIH